jgi:fatty acid desaturase
MELHPQSFYVHELKPWLPAHLFAPALSRLAWLPIHLAVIVLATIAIAVDWVPWPMVPVLSLAIGLSFAGLTFLGHETLHGGVVRGRLAWQKPIVGWIAFAPFTLSQQLWVVWHNRVHHANTQRIGADPDMYPTIEKYRGNALNRFSIDSFALGGRRWRGILSLVLGFTVQSKHMLFVGRSRLGMSAREFRRSIVETLLAVALWVAVAFLIGVVPVVFAYVVPLVIADVIVMGFILTNHGLSPATELNDPLVNSLSVTAPRWLEWVTLDFGYHVEHHLFPAMSGRHARQVRDALVQRWPGRYQTMPVLGALRRLHETGRVYKDRTTLCDPKTGGEWPALAPREDRRPPIMVPPSSRTATFGGHRPGGTSTTTVEWR